MTKILIVDDNEQNLYLLEVLLEKRGFEVAAAQNGREALQEAVLTAPDLVISDILMPVMDGFTLCRLWKQDEQLQTIPFIFYTATYTEEQDRQFGLSLGAERFIVKPIDPQQLLQIVEEVLKADRDDLNTINMGNSAKDGEKAYLQTYNKRLINKLEDKMLSLEQANKELSVFKELVDQSAVGMLVTDAEQKVVWFSHYLSEVFFLNRKQTEGWPLEVILKDRLSAHFVNPALFLADMLEAYGQTGGIQRYEHELVEHRNRTVKWVVYRVVPVTAGLYEEGHITYIYDITQRKQAAERLRVREEQLRQTQRLEAMGRLASGMAHDFKNLLMVIRAYADLIAKNPESEREKMGRNAQQILKATDTASELIQKLLAFGRQQEIQLEPVVVNELVERAINLLRPMVNDDINIEMALEERLPLIEADATHLEQALLNLALNACDAMPSGGRLTIRTASLPVEQDQFTALDLPSGSYVLILVNDTGYGMDKTTQARIFEPFFSTKREQGGTGLGLSMVHGTVMRLGGRIQVDSRLNHGTTFRLYLPAYQPEE